MRRSLIVLMSLLLCSALYALDPVVISNHVCFNLEDGTEVLQILKQHSYLTNLVAEQEDQIKRYKERIELTVEYEGNLS